MNVHDPLQPSQGEYSTVCHCTESERWWQHKLGDSVKSMCLWQSSNPPHTPMPQVRNNQYKGRDTYSKHLGNAVTHTGKDLPHITPNSAGWGDAILGVTHLHQTIETSILDNVERSKAFTYPTDNLSSTLESVHLNAGCNEGLTGILLRYAVVTRRLLVAWLDLSHLFLA